MASYNTVSTRRPDGLVCQRDFEEAYSADIPAQPNRVAATHKVVVSWKN
ncbi:hypothetical protein [Paenibacillus agricola]|uniref:Uncharacterized protein n=1 Tax=Paenibacillus agricola TaxID=2716264 RepID=A0ABX0JGM4_9BACL|nr:hypothetical protein [Paenibacillus agricola]NHN32820.1 hypothetical protein [Paenibacillus agricola]